MIQAMETGIRSEVDMHKAIEAMQINEVRRGLPLGHHRGRRSRGAASGNSSSGQCREVPGGAWRVLKRCAHSSCLLVLLCSCVASQLKSISQGVPAVSPANATPIEAAMRTMILEGTPHALFESGVG